MRSGRSGIETAVTPDLDIGQAGHLAQFYERDAFLAQELTRFIGDGLAAEQATVVIATRRHRRDLERGLRARGVDLPAARKAGRYMSYDAAASLSKFACEGRIDEARLMDVFNGVLGRAEQASGGRGVRVYGEMVALLCAEGHLEPAIHLEELWNDLQRRFTFALMCGYPISAFQGDDQGEQFLRMCGAHSHVVPTESYSALTDPAERLRTIAFLQQRTNALSTETAQLRQAEQSARQETRASHQTLLALVEASPLPIVVIEPDTTVRLWNPAAERVFGWTADEVLGRPIPIIPPEKVTECLRTREALLRGETCSGVETYRARRDGSRVHLVISAAALEPAADASRNLVLLFEEVNDRRRAEEARACLAAIVESSDDAIVGTTLDGIVTSWNRGAERLFGYTGEEIVGQPLTRLVPRDRRDELASILEAIGRGERTEHHETERVRKDGETLHVSLTVSPIRDAAGRVIGASMIARDVTDRKRADAEREELLGVAERARGQAEQASRAKDEFLAMLSHELRNPLSAVRNAVVTARLDERRRDGALEIARRQTEQLARLVDDLLDVSRITQGRIVLRKERVYLAELIDRAVEATRSLIEDRGHILEVSLPADGTLLDGDPTRLEQVIVNLLTNAAKYTERGGHIALVVERQAGEAVLRVRDSGVGIAPDMLPRVFDLFAQAERGLDRAKGGLGIGLTLVRSLVAMHGGRVEAHSEGRGKGAEFVVYLPATPAVHTTAPGAEPPALGTQEQARVRVLLVEDNPDAAESLAMLLELLGHHVRVVHDGLTALDVGPTSVPDLMLVDIGLPGMDGYELARRVRRHPALCRVVLVALTGYGREDDRQRALKAGFDHHLVKPVDPDTLQALVARLGKERRQAAPGPTVH